MLLLILWDKGLSWEGPGEGKYHFLSLPSSYCLVSSVCRGSETLPERLHHLAKPVALEAWCSLSFPSHPNPQTLATPFLRVILSLTHSPLSLLLPMGSALLQLCGEKEEQQQRPVPMQVRIPCCWRQRQTESAEERHKAENGSCGLCGLSTK